MPMYEYECAGCHHRFELLVRAGTVLECPSCHGSQLEKQLSAFAVGAEGGRPVPRPVTSGPCGACGDPRGPGSCSVN